MRSTLDFEFTKHALNSVATQSAPQASPAGPVGGIGRTADGRLKIILSGRVKGIDKAKTITMQTPTTSRVLNSRPATQSNAERLRPTGAQTPKGVGGALRGPRSGSRPTMGGVGGSILRPQSIDVPGGLRGKLEYASKGIYTK